jgi:hypothetical protein
MKDNLFLVKKACRNKISRYSLIMLLILFALGCKEEKKLLDTAINETRDACIASLSSDPNDKWNINNVKYDLGKEWHYVVNEEKVRVLYNQSFLFLLQKEETFSNKSSSRISKHIQTIYSCSGVPPHLTIIERTYFLEDPHGTIKVEKTEVLEGGKLVVAPTKEDTFFDVLQHQETYEKKNRKSK